MLDPNNDTRVRALGEHLFAHYLPELVPNAAGRYAAELLAERDDAIADCASAERDADSLREALADARAEIQRLNAALAAIIRTAERAL